jgi:xanthine dehydrogenase YagS FAD-binding subunit
MVNNFSYVKAGSLAEAIKELRAEGAWLHAGGTDLLGCARDEIFPIEKVVSISRLKNLTGISRGSGGSITIGALTTVADIASNESVLGPYTVLRQAAAAIGSPQIRQQGTIGGNLCQRPRCWYFRSDLQCRKKGGSTCYAMSGENQYHAIFGGGPCFFVHPSDGAVALAALEARLSIAGPSGNRTIKMEDFFVSPKERIDRENTLTSGEIITAISLPAIEGSVKSSYRKVGVRRAWDFALASVAAVLKFEGDTVGTARIVLGGVGPYPWRVEAAEKILAGKKLNGELAVAAGEAAVSGAAPLRDNAYKLEVVKGAVQESLASFI